MPPTIEGNNNEFVGTASLKPAAASEAVDSIKVDILSTLDSMNNDNGNINKNDNDDLTNKDGTEDRKMDLVLTKLDDILSRLERIEAIVNTEGSLSPKSTGRFVKSRAKNTSIIDMIKAQDAENQELNLHFYDNEYHVLPQEWILPRLSFEGLMLFWYLGDHNAGVPPLIKVAGTEFKHIPRGVRKRSDMKYLMKHAERKAKELGCYIENVDDWTPDLVRNLFAKTRQYFEYPNKSSAQTKFDKLSWETVCHNLRRNKGLLVGEESLKKSEVESETSHPPKIIPVDGMIPVDPSLSHGIEVAVAETGINVDGSSAHNENNDTTMETEQLVPNLQVYPPTETEAVQVHLSETEIEI